jgi:hypothetical protein
MLGLASSDLGTIREKKKEKPGHRVRGSAWMAAAVARLGFGGAEVQRGSDKEGERRSVRLSILNSLESCQLGGGPGFVAETVV